MQILFWNYVHPKNQDAPNREYFARPLPAPKIEDTKIEICRLEAGKIYTITADTIGYRSGDVYNAYLEYDLKESPTKEESLALLEKSKPKRMSIEVTADKNGKLVLFCRNKKTK